MARLIGLFVCLFLGLAFPWQAHAKPRPVIIVPGVMGSKLCDASGKVLWGDRASYTASRIKALRLPPNLKDRDFGIHPCGLIETVSVIPLFWESDVYVELTNFLESLGYTEGDIIRFDYDWRLSNFENAIRLKNRIDQIGGDQKVDIVAHSMGGMVARIYYQSLGGRDRVSQLIMLGTPHQGSAKIFERIFDGFDNWPDALSGGVPEIQSTILSFPSTYQLLPMYSECCGFSVDGNATKAQYVDALSNELWDCLPIPQDFRTGPYKQSLDRYLADARSLRTLFASSIAMQPDDSAKIHFIANGFLETWSRVFFDASTGKVTGHTLSPGDGSVLLFSATNGVPAQVQISSREHEKVFVGEGPELVMRAALSDKKWTAGSSSFEQTIWDSQGKQHQVKSGWLDIFPRIATSNEALTLTVTLEGGPDLIDADLSNFRLEIVADGPPQLIESLPTQEHQSGSVTVRFKVHAPNTHGPFSFRTVLPGLSPFSVPFAVVTP